MGAFIDFFHNNAEPMGLIVTAGLMLWSCIWVLYNNAAVRKERRENRRR